MARQITIDAIRAFSNNYKFKRSNTEVRVFNDEVSEPKQTELRLHGNLIAYKNNTGIYLSTCGWHSVTTKERLNGLSGVHIEQRDYIWYLNGNAWNGERVRIGGYLCLYELTALRGQYYTKIPIDHMVSNLCQHIPYIDRFGYILRCSI